MSEFDTSMFFHRACTFYLRCVLLCWQCPLASPLVRTRCNCPPRPAARPSFACNSPGISKLSVLCGINIIKAEKILKVHTSSKVNDLLSTLVGRALSAAAGCLEVANGAKCCGDIQTHRQCVHGENNGHPSSRDEHAWTENVSRRTKAENVI